MNKKSGAKLANKVKNLPVAPLVEVKKVPEDVRAQQNALSAPLPYPHPSSAPALWLDFAKTGRRLHRLCNEHHIPLDCALLEGVIRDCLRMLFKSVKRGDARTHALQQVAIRGCFDMLQETVKLGGGDAKAAVITLLNSTHYGCELLVKAAANEKSQEALKAVASTQSKWPFMLSTKKSSWEAAKNYLHDIGLGTDVPLAKMKDSHEKRWRELAGELINGIGCNQKWLRLQREVKLEADWPIIAAWLVEARVDQRPEIVSLSQAFGVNAKTCAEYWAVSQKMSASPDEQRRIFTLVVEANRWPKTVDLPELSSATCADWWTVAKEMLEAHWQIHAGEQNADFEKVKISAQGAGETPKVFAVRQVRQIFQNIAAKVSS